MRQQLSAQQPQHRRNDVFHQRIDNPAKCRPDNNADGQIDGIAAHQELLESAQYLGGLPGSGCSACEVVRSTGLEPVTPSFEGWCSIQLSYERA